MKAGDVYYLHFKVEDAAGAGVTGLLTGQFTVTDIEDGAAVALTVNNFAEIGGGWYSYDVTTGSTTATPLTLEVTSSNAAHVMVNNIQTVELEVNDLDALAAVVVTPVAVSTVTSTPAVDTQLVLDKDRYHEVRVSIVDQNGSAIDLSGYNNWSFDVETEAQDISPAYNQTTGISGTAGGLLSLDIPETASFFAELTAGNDTVTLYYNVKADKAATATQTQNIMRGTILLRRSESAAS